MGKSEYAIVSIVFLIGIVAIISIVSLHRAPSFAVGGEENIAGQATETYCPGVTITPIDTTVGVIGGQPFSMNVFATGYDSITISNLPSGLTFTPSTSGGTISGTASDAPVRRAIIQATKDGCTATEGFAIIVKAPHRNPTCNLRADDPISGQSANIRWYVDETIYDRPTGGSMNPSIGSQDYTTSGIAQTGPVTTTTTYKLTVTNPGGSFTCEVTIKPKQSTYDVVLKQQEPIYTWENIKDGIWWDAYESPLPFSAITYQFYTVRIC